MNQGQGNNPMETKPKVLIVDDEQFNLRLLKLKFQNAGYQVVLAEDGREGLEMFESESPDIIISDVKMPVMSGKEMSQRLPPSDKCLLIITTSQVEEKNQSWIQERPNLVFMEKPISPRVLVEMANQFIEQRRGNSNRIEEELYPDPQDSKSQRVGKILKDDLAEELAGRYDELNLIYRVGQRLRLNEQIDRALSELLKDTLDTLDSDGGLLFLSSSNSRYEERVFIDEHGPLKEAADSLKTVVEDRLQITTGPFWVTDSRKDSSLTSLPPMRLLIHPIVLDSGKTCGALVLVRDIHKKEFTTGDIRLLGMLAGHASIITLNHDLYLEMKQLLFSMVQSLSDAIEAKDSYTRGHTQRVSEISIAIGAALQLPAQGLEHLKWGSILHDIGKIGIPEQLLTKPAKLTDDEYAVMKKHPEIGYQIMNHIVPLREALSGVLHHHERFDGKGYPFGLRGTEIPLYGRILAVADTYDSMTSTRSYRKARTHEFAIDEIRRVSGEQLDPEIVGLFMHMIERDDEFLCKILKNAESHELDLLHSFHPTHP